MIFPTRRRKRRWGSTAIRYLGITLRGVALPLKSPSDPRPHIDMIFLYRRPILDYWCDTGEALETIVRHVLIHEIGHHFGFSDDDMERIEGDGDG